MTERGMDMRVYQWLRNLCIILAALLSHAMCAAVAYEYCALQWGGRYAGWSAPARCAFLLAVPFGLGIAACGLLAWLFHRKAKRTE